MICLRRAFASLLLASQACSDVFSPPNASRPELATLTLGTVGLVDGSTLWIDAIPRDTSFRLVRGTVPMQLTVSSGDEERPGLSRQSCPPRERGSHFNCFKFIVTMDAGVALVSIGPRVAAIGGRIEAGNLVGNIGNVVLFSPGRTAAAANDARRWPGVSTAVVSDFVFHPSWLTVPVPVDVGLPRPFDGTIQLRSGDTVRVAYDQPSGTVIVREAVAP